MNHPVDSNTSALYVAYEPDDRLERSVTTISQQLKSIVIVCNSEIANERILNLNSKLPKECSIHWIQNSDNLGLGHALNQGINFLISQGKEWFITFDQDSQPHGNLIDSLTNLHVEYQLSDVCIIGCNYYDTVRKEPNNSNSETTFTPRQTVITSGCLMNLKFIQSMGSFKEDFFIDQLDHELCLRARLNGATIIQTSEILMQHTVGRPDGIRLPILGILPNQNIERRYYIARNSMYLVKSYFFNYPLWSSKKLCKVLGGLFIIVLFEAKKMRKLRAVFRGISDGLQEKLGRCKHEFL